MNILWKSFTNSVMIWLMTILMGTPLARTALYFFDYGSMGPNINSVDGHILQGLGISLIGIAVFSAIFSLPFILIISLGLWFIENRKTWKTNKRIIYIWLLISFISICILIIFNSHLLGATKGETKMVNMTIMPFYLVAILSTFMLRKRFGKSKQNKILQNEKEYY